MSDSGQTFRSRDFELDVAAYELRRHGRPVRLERRAMDLLILLVERRRQLVSRRDIVDQLWGKDVFVDVETGVNTVISKVRQALHDSPNVAAFALDPSYALAWSGIADALYASPINSDERWKRCRANATCRPT